MFHGTVCYGQSGIINVMTSYCREVWVAETDRETSVSYLV